MTGATGVSKGLLGILGPQTREVVLIKIDAVIMVALREGAEGAEGKVARFRKASDKD